MNNILHVVCQNYEQPTPLIITDRSPQFQIGVPNEKYPTLFASFHGGVAPYQILWTRSNGLEPDTIFLSHLEPAPTTVSIVAPEILNNKSVFYKLKITDSIGGVVTESFEVLFYTDASPL